MAGIYIHIPFCKQACYYCNFHFSVSKKFKPQIINALFKEILLRKNELQNENVETIYFGGGTPSILTIEEISKFLHLLTTNFKVVNNPEITLEANPDDLSVAYLEGLKKAGINRLSIGVQSFFDDDLTFMNRAHNAKEALNCIKNAKRFFNNITIDLIYGMPNMSSQKWKQNLEIAFELEVPHISSYALTVEPKTALHNFIKKGKIQPVDEEQSFKHFKILVEETKKAGFVHYEISNFGKPNYFSKHNISYWNGKKYLGIGPSAHSFNGKQRCWNVANNSKYLKALDKNVLPLEVEELTNTDCYNEQIMTGLRTIWGVDLIEVKEKYGENQLAELLKLAEIYLDKKLLKIDNKKLLITEQGKFLADGIASNLFKI